jgi:hypothetical protein
VVTKASTLSDWPSGVGGWPPPGVGWAALASGKSSESVEPPTTTLPAPSSAMSVATSRAPPPRNVVQIVRVPSAESLVTNASSLSASVVVCVRPLLVCAAPAVAKPGACVRVRPASTTSPEGRTATA